MKVSIIFIKELRIKWNGINLMGHGKGTQFPLLASNLFGKNKCSLFQKLFLLPLVIKSLVKDS